MRDKKENKGQVWIETVLYTIIGLAIISVVLAFMIPKIDQTKDKLLVEQSIDSLKVFDQKMQEVLKEKGSRGLVELKLKRGEFIINSTGNSTVIYIGDLSYLYSEPGVPIKQGNLIITSQEGSDKNSVSIKANYFKYNITYAGKDELKKMNPSTIPYIITIENNGTQIDIRGQ